MDEVYILVVVIGKFFLPLNLRTGFDGRLSFNTDVMFIPGHD
jgi:hypothetical protein